MIFTDTFDSVFPLIKLKMRGRMYGKLKQNCIKLYINRFAKCDLCVVSLFYTGSC